MNIKTIAMASAILTMLGSGTLFAQTGNNNSSAAVSVSATTQAAQLSAAMAVPALDVQPGIPEPDSINMAATDTSSVYFATTRVRPAHWYMAYLEFRQFGHAQKVDTAYTNN